jgi:D-3-phosphoglycerate dehydrogenase
MGHSTVAVTERLYESYADEETVLGDVDAALVVFSLRSRAEAIDALRDAHGILVHQFPIDEALIRELKACRIISRYGIGLDNVDVPAATRAGIWVANVPEYGAEESVSDQALALLLGCVRKVSFKDREIRRGNWNLLGVQKSYLVKGKTLGIIGYGQIGRAFRRKCSGLGCSAILVYDPFADPERIARDGCVNVEFEQLLRTADFISIHAPLTPETFHLIDAFAMMKPTAILVNTSRGALVDEKALCTSIHRHAIQGAGLDVFETEPPAADSALRSLDDVILSDHSGYYAEETLRDLRTKAARNVAMVLGGGHPDTPVNRPREHGGS